MSNGDLSCRQHRLLNAGQGTSERENGTMVINITVAVQYNHIRRLDRPLETVQQQAILTFRKIRNALSPVPHANSAAIVARVCLTVASRLHSM